MVPLALVLALVTGAVLHATQVVVLAPAVTPARDAQIGAYADLIDRFYDAVNEAFATGRSPSLDAILDTNFVDHVSGPGPVDDRAGFLRSLRSLHAVAPAMRLRVVDVLVQDDRVAAKVAAIGGEGAVFLGLPVPAAFLWGETDLFRVEAGRIAERWGDPAAPPRFDPLLLAAVPIVGPTGKVVTLERWTFAPSAAETRETDLGFFVLLVDAGELTVRTMPGAEGALPGASSEPGTGRRDRGSPALSAPTVLGSGDGLAVARSGPVTLRNEGAVPAVVLVVAAAVPVPSASPETALGPPTGVRHEVLAGGPVEDLPAGEASVSIGRIALESGTGLPSHTVGIAELSWIEGGSLTLAGGGRAWVTSLPNALPRDSSAGSLPAGSGLRVDRGNVVGYHNAGDNQLALLLVTILPIPVEPDTMQDSPQADRPPS